MVITEKQILDALATVDDPDLKQDLVTLGMVKDIEIKDKAIYFTVVLTTPACPLKELIRNNCIDAIHKLVASDLQVFVKMTSNVTSTRQGPILPGVKNIIAIGSGKGGVGKSTVTSNLAIALAQKGAKVGLIDADIFGPSIPTMFNCEGARPGVIEKDDGKYVLIPLEQYGVKLLSIGFVTAPKDAIVWRGPMASSALKQFITDTDWGELDYLLIDLPPGTSDVHLTLVQTVPVTGAVVVTTPQKVALDDAQKAVSMFHNPKINVPVLGIVENMSYFIPPDMTDKKYYIFGKNGGHVLASRNEVPFLGELPLVQTVREAGDSGAPVILDKKSEIGKSFADVAEELARAIAVRNAKLGTTKVVEITRT
ncbi:MAG: Mrp/NBP35 family ATP-binding protein [Bernardetiaceae bacterium]|nr:Mrp/NBP35 family ATP-binding protein [Bernardetiaceae bacterium]